MSGLPKEYVIEGITIKIERTFKETDKTIDEALVELLLNHKEAKA